MYFRENGAGLKLYDKKPVRADTYTEVINQRISTPLLERDNFLLWRSLS